MYWILWYFLNGVQPTPGTGTANSSSTATSSGVALAKSTGTANGSSSALGVGLALRISTGNAPGSSSASGVGVSLRISTGTAPGSSTASGVGVALAITTGTAPGSSSATGTTVVLATSTGTASGSSSALGVGTTYSRTGGFSDLGAILLNVQNKLISDNVLSQNQVALSVYRRPFPQFSSKFYATIIPGDQDYLQPCVMGGGRYTSEVLGTFSIYVYAQNAVDSAYTDEYALTNASTGLLSLVLNICNSLQLYLPVDVVNIPLTFEPIRLIHQGETAPFPGSPEWTYTALTFQIRYGLNIDFTVLPGGSSLPVNGDLGSVLLAAKNQLVASNVFAQHQVALSVFRGPIPEFASKFYASLVPVSQDFLLPMVVGGGRTTSETRALFSLIVYAQNARDMAYVNTEALTNQTTGLLTLVFQSADSLQLFSPLNGSAPIVMEPVRLVSQTAPQPFASSPDWTFIALTLEARIALNITGP